MSELNEQWVMEYIITPVRVIIGLNPEPYKDNPGIILEEIEAQIIKVWEEEGANILESILTNIDGPEDLVAHCAKKLGLGKYIASYPNSPYNPNTRAGVIEILTKIRDTAQGLYNNHYGDNYVDPQDVAEFMGFLEILPTKKEVYYDKA